LRVLRVSGCVGRVWLVASEVVFFSRAEEVLGKALQVLA
jgi:hypothetical protein